MAMHINQHGTSQWAVAHPPLMDRYAHDMRSKSCRNSGRLPETVQHHVRLAKLK